MYKPKTVEEAIQVNEFHALIDEANKELMKHCELIGALQAINCNLLDRIRMLEEKNINCH